MAVHLASVCLTITYGRRFTVTAPPTKQQRKTKNRDPLKTRVISVAALSPTCHPPLVLLVYCALCSFQELQRAFTQAMMDMGYWILVGTGG